MVRAMVLIEVGVVEAIMLNYFYPHVSIQRKCDLIVYFTMTGGTYNLPFQVWFSILPK